MDGEKLERGDQLWDINHNGTQQIEKKHGATWRASDGCVIYILEGNDDPCQRDVTVFQRIFRT